MLFHWLGCYKEVEELLGIVEIVVNNAGILDESNVEGTLDINLVGA